MKFLKVAIIVGTRPEIIKMSPIIKICDKRNIEYDVIHTQQHYSNNMDKIFFQDLGLKYPDIALNVKSGSAYSQISDIISKCGEIFLKNNYNVVLVQGDTNSVLGAAIAAHKCGIKIGHVEAGLRSFDRSMPEEINRILTDSISDYLFCPTNTAKKYAMKENIEEKRIFVVGNSIVDALYQSRIKIDKSILNKNDLAESEYILATLHRPANVDCRENLKNIIETFNIIVERLDIPIIFPIHPRTKKNIDSLKIEIANKIKIIEPIGYFDFLSLQNYSKMILTDSGGIQEEACILQKPCITLRENTERPETVTALANILTGLVRENILNAVSYWINSKNFNWDNPFGDGKTAQKIINIILN